jgi:predicted alpha/beta-hydrolase family hydrolase
MPFAFDVHVGSAKTSALLYPGADPHATLVLAHGAGGRQMHPFMVGVAERLGARGFDVVTFDFLYTHAGRRLPDKSDVLEATWRAVIDAVRARKDVFSARLLIGGKSMGGRIATQVAGGGGAGVLAGLVLLGYPLHPPGKPQQLRAAHLPSVRAPMLFLQGAKDTFGTPEELAPIVAPLFAGTRLVPFERGDHSLAVRAVPLQDTLDRVADEVADFERGLGDG